MITTATSLQATLEAGEISSQELAARTLARIAEANEDWRIFTEARDFDTVAREARLSDERRRSGKLLGPLDGIPVAVKDNIDVAGMVTYAGTGHDFGGRAVRDATAVARLRAAGAIVVGKLNMHEGALGATTDNPFWGRCENPAVPGHTPGGSSGGSGAAVAGGLVPIALGTDTMGSVRIPAAYCGVWGLKPTRGLVGNRGLHYLSWDLDSIGPLASSADDLAAAISVMAGLDLDDPDSLATPSSWSVSTGHANTLEGRILGYVDAAELTECEDVVLAAYEATLRRAERAGAKLRAVKIDGWDPSRTRRYGLLVSEAQGGSLLKDAMGAYPEQFSENFRKLLDYGRNATAERLAQAEWALKQLRPAFFRGIDGIDALMMPTAPQLAFAHGAPAPANQADFTALANFIGTPALAFPVATAAGTAAASVQCVGRPFDEGLLLCIGRNLGPLEVAKCS